VLARVVDCNILKGEQKIIVEMCARISEIYLLRVKSCACDWLQYFFVAIYFFYFCWI